jgi:hypothetical protein
MMRAKTQVETLSLGGGRQARNALIVTELPYQVNKVREKQRWRDEALGGGLLAWRAALRRSTRT